MIRFATFVLLAALAVPARADTADNRKICGIVLEQSQAAQIAAKIAACSALLDTGQLVGDDLVAVLGARGEGYRLAGNFAEAARDFDAAIATYGKERVPDNRIVDITISDGIVYQQLKRPARAIAMFDRALALRSGATKALFGRAQSFLILGAYQRALQDLDLFILGEPNLADAYEARGIAYFQLSENTRAIQDFDYALLLQPDLRGGYYHRGLAYDAAGQFALAIQDFDREIAAAPPQMKAAAANPADVNFFAARDFASALRDREAAKEHAALYAERIAAVPPPARDAHAPEPSDPGEVPTHPVGRTHDCSFLYPRMSRRLQETGDVIVSYDVDSTGAVRNVFLRRSSGSPRLDRAAVACVSTLWRNTPALKAGAPVYSPAHVAMVRYAMEQPPHDATAFLIRAGGFLGIGQYARALDDYGQAIALTPGSAEAFYGRGILYYLLGQPDKAAADLAQALHLKPDYQDAADARDLVDAEKDRFPKPLPTPGHSI